ncbi:MAG: DUF3857 domain-containing transglutaminase family protein [Vulcanimicrobiota bacterium]
MQKKSLSITVLICTVIILSMLSASSAETLKKAPPDVQKMIESAGGTSEYPDADSIIIKEDIEITYQDNGDYTTRERSLIKILTENGKKDYSTLTFSYHRRYQNVEIPSASVIYPDGTLFEIPKDAVKDTTEAETQEMNIFEENFRQKSVTVPSLSVGCSIAYEAVTTTKALLKDNYTDAFMFQGSEPLLSKKVTINGPSSRPLHYIVKNGSLTFKESKEGNRITYQWQAQKVPMIITEPGMVSIGDVGTKLVVGTFKDWKEISRFGDSLNQDKLDSTPEMKETVKKLTSGLATEDEKILAIFRFISQKIRYMGSAMDIGAFIEPHKASYTFEKQYGVCRDKSVLMASMLREIGVHCDDVLINVNIDTVPEIPTVYFQHAICAVKKKDGSVIFMDPTLELSSSMGESYTGDKHVLLLTKEGNDLAVVPHVPAERSLGTLDAATSLGNDGTLTGNVHLSGTGYYDLVLRSINREYTAVQFERVVGQLGTYFHPKTTVSDVVSKNPSDLSKPYSFSFKLTTPSYAVPAGRYLLLPLPLFTSSFDLVVNRVFSEYTRLKERKYPMSVFSTCGFVQKNNLSIPEGYSIVSLPPSLTLRKGPVTASMEVKSEGRTIAFRSDCRIEKTRLTPLEYQDLRSVSIELKRFARSMVILEKK